MTPIRVVAYCRVSTDHTEQLQSLAHQKQYFESYINKNLDWSFVKIYADEGISGTSIKKRVAFQQMLQDGKDHKFDLILVKEISRFARNTLDSIMYTRKLKDMGIGVIFINDNINTLDPSAELRLTIMASIAQEESRKTSERVQWGILRTMEKGFVLGNGCYGYHLKNGTLTVNEDEAKIVRLIFDLYLQGLGTYKISKTLENKGILSPSGLKGWKNTSILKILQNEKYAGTLKQRKHITVDYLEHKKILNNGQVEFITIENHHEPIINMEAFKKVQEEISRRKNMEKDKKKYSNTYAFSNKITCGLCGATFRRRYRNGKHEQKNVVWACSENTRNGKKKYSAYGNGHTIGCDCRGIHDTILQEMFLDVMNNLIQNKEQLASEIKNTIDEILRTGTDNSKAIADVKKEIVKYEAKKTKLIELYTDNFLSRQDFNTSNEQYNRQLEDFENQLLKLEAENENTNILQEKQAQINQIVNNICACEEFSEEVCKEVIQKIVVYSRDSIDFFFTSDINASLSIPLSIMRQGLMPLTLNGKLRFPCKIRRSLIFGESAAFQ